jgi:hypothetical protein
LGALESVFAAGGMEAGRAGEKLGFDSVLGAFAAAFAAVLGPTPVASAFAAVGFGSAAARALCSPAEAAVAALSCARAAADSSGE